MLMARTTAPERSHFFKRSNFEFDASKQGPARPVVRRPERPFGAVVQESLGLIDHAIARIKQREQADAALRELSATLLGLRDMVVYDPGIRMAADDLYGAASALVVGQSTGPDGVDARRWRLLKEADARLRTRLASAQPSEKATLLGLN